MFVRTQTWAKHGLLHVCEDTNMGDSDTNMSLHVCEDTNMGDMGLCDRDSSCTPQLA
jgi:hypothetical protein